MIRQIHFQHIAIGIKGRIFRRRVGKSADIFPRRQPIMKIVSQKISNDGSKTLPHWEFAKVETLKQQILTFKCTSAWKIIKLIRFFRDLDPQHIIELIVSLESL